MPTIIYSDEPVTVYPLTALPGAPALDAVRAGKISVDDVRPGPVIPMDSPLTKPFREEVRDFLSVRLPPGSGDIIDELVDGLIQLARNRRLRRTLNEQPDVARAGGGAVGRKNTPTPHKRVPESCIELAILSRCRVNQNFTLGTARAWMKMAGYNPNSASPACSNLVQMGYLIRPARAEFTCIKEAHSVEEMAADREALYSLWPSHATKR